MISNLRVTNRQEVPKEYQITKHEKRCPIRDKSTPLSGYISDIILVANHYEALYFCRKCWRTQRIWFMIKRIEKGGDSNG